MLIGRKDNNFEDEDLAKLQKTLPISSNLKVPIQLKPSEQRNVSVNS